MPKGTAIGISRSAASSPSNTLPSECRRTLGSWCVHEVDAPPQGREVEFHVEVYFARRDVFRPIREVSPVVDALARSQFDEYVKRVRVYVHPRLKELLPAANEFDELVDEAV
jgi:hypothetical protein